MVDFREYLKQKNLAPTSITSYCNAVMHKSQDMANKHHLTDRLISQLNPEEFYELYIKLQNTDEFIRIDKKGHRMYSKALDYYSEYINEEEFLLKNKASVYKDITKVSSNKSLSDTQKETLILARLGQGKFREDLIEYWKCCAVTKYNNISLLIASHIKPWAESNENERLDPYNGLLLTPNIDKAFDRGFISFNSDGNIVVSPHLKTPQVLGINNQMSIKIENQHMPYLEFHYNNVFKK